jgi:hypothetical protein
MSPGKADGVWGRKSENALKVFLKYNDPKLASFVPNEELLKVLNERQLRGCPITCRVDQKLSNDRCVAKTCSWGMVLNSKGKCQRIKATPKIAPMKKSTKVQKTKSSNSQTKEYLCAKARRTGWVHSHPLSSEYARAYFKKNGC